VTAILKMNQFIVLPRDQHNFVQIPQISQQIEDMQTQDDCNCSPTTCIQLHNMCTDVRYTCKRQQIFLKLPIHEQQQTYFMNTVQTSNHKSQITHQKTRRLTKILSNRNNH